MDSIKEVNNGICVFKIAAGGKCKYKVNIELISKAVNQMSCCASAYVIVDS